jgi:hypothetical protein
MKRQKQRENKKGEPLALLCVLQEVSSNPDAKIRLFAPKSKFAPLFFFWFLTAIGSNCRLKDLFSGRKAP